MPTLYLKGGDIQPPNGASVHVKYSYGAFLQKNAQTGGKLASVVGHARTALDDVIGYMTHTGRNNLSSDFQYYADKYFFTQGSLSNDEFNALLTVLTMTRSGINGDDLSVKVFKNKNSAKGYVNSHSKKKSHTTPGVRVGSDGVEKTVNKGDIHLRLENVEASTISAAKTFIHEATHKFAATADFGEKGYTDDNGNYRAEGLTKTQAFMNADSYAQFVIRFQDYAT